MKAQTTYISSFLLFFCWLAAANGQPWSLHGQASGWLLTNPDTSPLSQLGFRYIPEFSIGEKIDSSLTVDMDISLNSFAFGNFAKDVNPEYEKNIKLYRGWLRLVSNAFEIRAGLQKINFGSATLFRPLMWFDKVDPRDPLQLTNGVNGVLVRYYFLNNTNVWMWDLYGNDEIKGLEITPTKKSSMEYGGRFQLPLINGEAGFSYHHRNTDISGLETLVSYNGDASVPENRFGLDGKWDIGIGVWFEAVLVHEQTDLPRLKYQRQWTVGADYTFDIGNGLTALTEFFRSDNPNDAFGQARGVSFSALSMNYPLGVIDRLSALLYFNWTNHDWYRLVTWQKTYDNWIFYLLGFWNPKTIQFFQTQTINNTFAGTGIQFMVVFNH